LRTETEVEGETATTAQRLRVRAGGSPQLPTLLLASGGFKVSTSAAGFEHSKVTVPAVLASKGERKLAMVTAYDCTFARLADRAGADLLLVGDSLGMVVQGRTNTLGVTMDQMVYHSSMVARGSTRSLVVTD